MLLATFQSGQGRSQARMSKIELAALTRPGAIIKWTPGEVEFLDTDLTEDGKRVRLEVVLFKPKGSGSFPLVVFNHGSTGMMGLASFTVTWSNTELADFFLEKGWMIAFPQRRGRGESDGLYDEGFATDRAQGYSCDPSRSLPGADRALNDIEAAIAALQRRPDVAGKRLLIGGVSRGGILSIAYDIRNRSSGSSTSSGAGSASVARRQGRSTEHYLNAARNMIERRCGFTAGAIRFTRLRTVDRITRPLQQRAARECLSNLTFPAGMVTSPVILGLTGIPQMIGDGTLTLAPVCLFGKAGCPPPFTRPTA
jgi:dienelactone hydrolase